MISSDPIYVGASIIKKLIYGPLFLLNKLIFIIHICAHVRIQYDFITPQSLARLSQRKLYSAAASLQLSWNKQFRLQSISNGHWHSNIGLAAFFSPWKKGTHFRGPAQAAAAPHQLCIPLLSDGQHCLTANRESRPWKMLLFYRQKKS